MKTILTSIYAGLFYIVWLPTVMLKDITSALYNPFDTQRFVNAFVAFNKNARNIVDYINEVPVVAQVEPVAREPIGFKTYARIDCQSPSIPENPVSPD